MGFYPQPNDWSCGPFALKHALIALGQFTTEARISKEAKPHWWTGTDELRLAKAAAAFDCDLETIRLRTAEVAKKKLVDLLKARIPVLLCVDQWSHWIVALRTEGNLFVIVDSDVDPVLNVVSWTRLRKRWRYLDVQYSRDLPPELYDLMPVVPRSRARMRADFSVKRAKFLIRKENQVLADQWDQYVEDLADICRPRGRLFRALSMAEFLRRNENAIVASILHWHGDVTQSEVRRLLGHFRFVAETYGLVIPGPSQKRAVLDITVLATLWVTSRHGVGPIYAPVKRKRRRGLRQLRK
jgi:hypothetical protein